MIHFKWVVVDKIIAVLVVKLVNDSRKVEKIKVEKQLAQFVLMVQ